MRWYDIDGFKYPSVTTILDALPADPVLANWKRRTKNAVQIMKSSTVVGSIVHFRIERYFANRFGFPPGELEYSSDKEPLVLTEELVDNVNVAWSYFMEFVKEKDPRPIDVEKRTHHLEYGYAGTYDLRAKLSDGLIWLIDYKTSKKSFPKHAAQLSAYRRAIVSHGGQVDKVGVLVLNGVNERYNLIEKKDRWDTFIRALSLFTGQVRGVKAYEEWVRQYGDRVGDIAVPSPDTLVTKLAKPAGECCSVCMSKETVEFEEEGDALCGCVSCGHVWPKEGE